MVKIATITPIDCITHKEDGEVFGVWWNNKTGDLLAIFESGTQEPIGYTATTIENAINITYDLYALSNAYIYEREETEE